MGKLSVFVLSFLAGAVVFTANGKTPFGPDEEKRFVEIENGARRLLKNEYNFTLNNAASGDVISLPNKLPASALIINSFSFIKQDIISASSNTIAIKCESAGDLHAATDQFVTTGNQTIIAGVVTAVTAPLISHDGCTVTLTVGIASSLSGSSGITAGKLVHFLEYVVPEYVK